MDVLELTKKLVSIPSYVSEEVNESSIGDFIAEYLQRNTSLKIIKQLVEGNRANIIAYSPSCITSEGIFNVDTLFVDHIDTVEPKQGWETDQFIPTEKNGNLYGLGTADTKANVAVLLKLAEKVTNQKCMFLFYIDEEYDFKGMNAFINEYKSKLSIKQIISADGEELKIRNACRGLVELEIECFGKTGHSANPANGINVISKFYALIQQLDSYFNTQVDESTGKTTINVAYLQAGLNRGMKNNQVVIGKSGNNIPDYLESIIELRPNAQFNFDATLEQLNNIAESLQIKVRIKNVKHNLKPWSTPQNSLTSFIQTLRKINSDINFTDASKSGYVDVALLNEAFNCPCWCIGTKGANRHGANEYVEINSIYTLETIFTSYFNDYFV